MVIYESSSSRPNLLEILNALFSFRRPRISQKPAAMGGGLLPGENFPRTNVMVLTNSVGLSLAVLYFVGQLMLKNKDDHTTTASVVGWCREKLREVLERKKATKTVLPPKEEQEDQTIVTHEGSCHCEAILFEVSYCILHFKSQPSPIFRKHFFPRILYITSNFFTN